MTGCLSAAETGTVQSGAPLWSQDGSLDYSAALAIPQIARSDAADCRSHREHGLVPGARLSAGF